MPSSRRRRTPVSAAEGCALYGFLAGNPLAAMPSLHFATSIMAAHLLGEAGRVQGAVAWSYARTLGFALVPRAHGGAA